jgi:DNA-binding winged helix-turn-helix (wHTH) protein
MTPASRFQLGEFTLEIGTRQLLERGQAVHLSSRAFDLLHILVDRRPRVVSKQQLHDLLWPDTFVSEVNLATLVAELRRALRDDAGQPRFIRTVYRHGYAFSGTATDQHSRTGIGLEAAGTHWLVWNAGQAQLSKGENVLGRGRRVAVWLDSPTISRRHAKIVITAASAALEDLGSRNGTYLRGEKVTSPVPLNDGDEIRVGSVVLSYRINSGQSTTVLSEA